ncbi:endoglin isoform X2 [Candoia aspera]|uniref:endoglin isoform X2 n=1 Tax=Candoia aspera TaxID=51853 RepID=UPI002FD7AC3D
MALWHLAMLFLISGTAATTASKCHCSRREPISKDQAVRVFYTTSVVPSGCEAHGPTAPDLEVHVLNLRHSSSQMSTVLLNVSGRAAKEKCKAVFVVNSNSSLILTIHPEGDCRLVIIHAPHSYLMPPFNEESNITSLPFSSDQLLMWAKEMYGGISSFAELEDPQQIHFQVGREPSANEDCILAQNFNAEPYLEVDVVSHKVETCLDSRKVSGKLAHILWLQQSSSDERMQTVELNVKMVCRDRSLEKEAEIPLALWLKSHQNTVWKMGPGLSFVQLSASGKYSVPVFGMQNGVALPDSKEELIQKARNNSFVASYTEIPSAKTITLEYDKLCGSSVATTTQPPPQRENLTVLFHRFIDLCKPWKCLDSSIEIAIPKTYLEALPMLVDEITLKDPSCRARDNSTHFVLNSILDKCSTQLEGGIHVKNQFILTLPVFPGKVTVPFECDLPEKVSLQLYNTADFHSPSAPVVEANQVTFVEVSFRTAIQQFSLEIGDCFLKTQDNIPQLLFYQEKSLSYSVMSLKSPSPKTQRFSFIYKPEDELWSIKPATLACMVHLNTSNEKLRSYEGSLEVMLQNPQPHNRGLRIGTVLGIAFGAFLIGVLLTGALWCIYSHTRPIAKTQPVSANPSASESSSTNHSLGSTQSTPCSTSSMA